MLPSSVRTATNEGTCLHRGCTTGISGLFTVLKRELIQGNAATVIKLHFATLVTNRGDMIIKYILILCVLLSLPVVLFAQDTEEEEENPHTEMVEDEFVCLDCHTDIPKEGETSATYFLVDKPSENCLGCHDETQHAGAKEHDGQKAEHLPGMRTAI